MIWCGRPPGAWARAGKCRCMYCHVLSRHKMKSTFRVCTSNETSGCCLMKKSKGWKISWHYLFKYVHISMACRLHHHMRTPTAGTPSQLQADRRAGSVFSKHCTYHTPGGEQSGKGKYEKDSCKRFQVFFLITSYHTQKVFQIWQISLQIQNQI